MLRYVPRARALRRPADQPVLTKPFHRDGYVYYSCT
jgi:hypothetical protein